MSTRLYYIRDGKQYRLNGGKEEALPDGILGGYIRRTAESARRSEWKTSGEGAKFTGVYDPSSDPQSRIQSIRSQINGIGEFGGSMYFSERIDSISGIYRKTNAHDTSEAIAVSSNDRAYLSFDIRGDRLAVSVGMAGEAHIAVSTLPSFDVSTVTEGDTVELDPSWSGTEPDVLYFSSAGLPRRSAEPQSESAMPFTPAAIMSGMSSQTPATLGPSAICRLNLRTGAFDTLFEDDRFDFTKPQSAPDGGLYYIKKPYGAKKQSGSGCITDALLLPVRLIRALFGFLSFFSIKYSGTPLSSGQSKAKSKDAGQIFIDGNLINAEKELKANSGDAYPGIIPKSYELWKSDGSEQKLIACGVLCYTLDGDGNVVYSNGRYIIRIADGKPEKLAAADGAACLKFLNIE